jgi:hypothetical protein
MTQETAIGTPVIESSRGATARRGSQTSAFGCLVRGCLVVALVPVIACCGGGFYFWSQFNQATAKRDALIKDIAAKGEPVTADDLTQWAKRPAEVPDQTEPYQAILAHYADLPGLSPEEERLPIVGPKATGGVPDASELWPEQPVAENYLSHRPWLDDAEELGQTAGAICIPRDYSTGINARHDDVQAMRALVRDLQLRFSVRLRSGDRAGALRSLKGVFRFSGALAYELVLVEHLVRIALHGVGVHMACEFLRDGQATQEEIDSIREMLTNDFRLGLSHCLKGERASELITLRAYNFQQLREMGDDVDPKSGKFPLEGKVADLFPGDTALLLELFKESIDIVEQNGFPEITQGLTNVETKLQQLGKDERSAMIWDKHIITFLMLPATGAMGTAFGRATASEEALKAALDVEEKLLALSPGDRTKEAEEMAIRLSLPIDPFTGQPMKYTVSDEGYAIYSVGPDGLDEGGPSEDRKIKDYGVRIKRTLAKAAQK